MKLCIETLAWQRRNHVVVSSSKRLDVNSNDFVIPPNTSLVLALQRKEQDLTLSLLHSQPVHPLMHPKKHDPLE